MALFFYQLEIAGPKVNGIRSRNRKFSMCILNTTSISSLAGLQPPEIPAVLSGKVVHLARCEEPKMHINSGLFYFAAPFHGSQVI